MPTRHGLPLAGSSRRALPLLLLALLYGLLALLPAPTHAADQRAPVVAVVNCMPYHLEVVLGVVGLVKSLQYDLELYTYHNDGVQEGHRVREALSLLHERYGNFTVSTCADLAARSADSPLDALFFVSGQEEVKFHRSLFQDAVTRLHPPALLAIVHNTARKSLTDAILQLHPPSTLLALSHVSHRSLARVHRRRPAESHLNWILPTIPLADGTPCLAAGPLCTTTFALQGNLDPKRRDFAGLYAALLPHLPTLNDRQISIKFIGAAKSRPAIPLALAPVVALRLNLDFFHFYREVAGAIALLPLLPSNDYLNGTKITSTVITSLITGVPILADADFLAAYRFLPSTAVYLQHPRETVADAMLRVAALGEADHRRVRLQLQDVRRRLDQHNLRVVRHYMSRFAMA